MIERLQQIEDRHAELTSRLADPRVLSDPKAYREASKQLKDLEPVVRLARERRILLGERAQAEELLGTLDKSDELWAMAVEERDGLDQRLAALADEIRRELTPKDPNDSRNVVLEIRAGTGGDEATLFAAELLRMYSRYAEGKGWRIELIDLSESPAGGVKEVSAIVEGRGAWSRLKFEGGVHRVQRVPATEAQGRIHTSAVTVAVLPEAEDVEIDLPEKDLRIDVYRSTGPGGQSVNTTDSAVRITHLPSGITAACQNERSQLQNRAVAMRILKARLAERMRQEQQNKLENLRGERKGIDFGSQIRSYVLAPYRLVKDHRTNVEIGDVDRVMDGDLDELIEAELRRRAESGENSSHQDRRPERSH